VALARPGVSYTINFYDSGKSGKSSSDTFGIRIVYTPVAPQPVATPDVAAAKQVFGTACRFSTPPRQRRRATRASQAVRSFA